MHAARGQRHLLANVDVEILLAEVEFEPCLAPLERAGEIRCRARKHIGHDFDSLAHQDFFGAGRDVCTANLNHHPRAAHLRARDIEATIITAKNANFPRRAPEVALENGGCR